MLSFVYDVADLYKTEVTIPIAFKAAAEGKEKGLERLVRIGCRDSFVENRLLERIIPDIQTALMMTKHQGMGEDFYDLDAAAPGSLWDPLNGAVDGGRVHTMEDSGLEVLNDSLDS